MAKTTIKPQNILLPAPRWFRRTKDILTILFDASILIAFLYGFTDNSKEILIARIAYSAVMNSLDKLLANGEVYAAANNFTSMGKNQNEQP